MVSLWVLSLLSSVRVEGAVTCPTPAAVSAALSELAPSSDRQDVASLEASATGLSIELRDGRGEVISRRTLPSGPSCEELAHTAAVLIAAWEAQVPAAETTPQLPAPPPLLTAREPEPGFALRVFGVGVGVAAAWSSSVAPGATAHAFFGPSDAWGLALDVGTSAVRTVALAPGTVDWQRWTLGVGGSAQLARFGWGLGLYGQAELLGSLLTLAGRGFTQSGSAFNLDPGLRVGLRAAYPFGRWHAFLEGSAEGWIWNQQADVTNVGSVPLPRFEAAVAVGVGYGHP